MIARLPRFGVTLTLPALASLPAATGHSGGVLKRFIHNFSVLLVTVFCFSGLQVQTTAAENPPQFILQWGTSGTDTSQFMNPAGIATDSQGNVYVTDIDNNRVQKFTSDGVYITEWGPTGSSESELVEPHGIAIDASDNVFVSQRGSTSLSSPLNRVKVFTSNGAYIGQFGNVGTNGEGKLRAPRGLAVDPSGYVYVCDWGNGRIQKFTNAGTYVRQWGVSAPFGVTVDANYNVFVADYTISMVRKYDSDGNPITAWGGGGDGEYLFHQVTDVAADGGGDVYVVDSSNYHIKQYDNNGLYLTQWGNFDGYDNGHGDFFNLSALTVSNDGYIYVVDHFKIQKFNPGSTTAVNPPAPSASLQLAPPSPNPSLGATQIRFALAEPGEAVVRVYGMDGRLVRTLIDASLPAGEKSVTWDGRDEMGRNVAAGPYIVQFRAADTTEAQRVMRLR